MKYKKLNGGNDSKSKELVKKMFKEVYGWEMEMTSKFCYVDGIIRFGNKVMGIEIKDRTNSYYSYQFDDVVCETYKYDKYLYDKKHPNTA